MNTESLNILLEEVLVCICNDLNNGVCNDGLGSACGCPCRLFVSAGPVVWDAAACCSDGQLSIHVDRLYPFKNFPSQSGEVANCGTELGADVVVTLLRCWPAILHEDGTAPTGPEIDAAAKGLNRDLVLVSKSILCCLGGNKQRPFIFQGSRIVGPDGGCAGVEARFTIPVY